MNTTMIDIRLCSSILLFSSGGILPSGKRNSRVKLNWMRYHKTGHILLICLTSCERIRRETRVDCLKISRVHSNEQFSTAVDNINLIHWFEAIENRTENRRCVLIRFIWAKLARLFERFSSFSSSRICT